MKKILVFVLVFCFALLLPSYATNPITPDGYYKGIPLTGKVRIVNYNGNFRVKVSEHFPDLNVKLVERFPDDVGEWQIVEYGEDFTIEFVNYGEDFSIRFVTSFPGVT